MFFGVARPWYIVAELTTPGFWHYFFVNEHFRRYVSNDYGDLYGYGRKQPLGTIWLMLAGSFLPWTILALALVWAWAGRLFRGQKFFATLRADPWLTYVLIWGLAPALFFTLARQVLFTYVLPGLPGLALATAVGLDRWMESEKAAGLRCMLRQHLLALPLLASIGIIACEILSVYRWKLAAPGQAVAVASGGVAGMVVLGIAAWWIARRWGSTAAVGMLGLMTAVIFTTALFLGGPLVDERQSAKVVLEKLYAQNPAAVARPVVVPLSDTTSSVPYYVQTVHHGTFKPCRVKDADVIRGLLDGRGNEIFLLEKRDLHEWNELGPKLLARFVLLVETEHWIAYEERHAP